MSLVSRSIPGLFGGVSQKIPALRHPTQGSAQDNGICTVVDGLYKRAGTRHVATLAVTGPNGLTVANSLGEVTGHFIDRGVSGRHVLVIKNGSLMVYEMTTGAVQTVSMPQGYAYLTAANPATAFRCLTVADTTFIVNTEVVPKMTTLLTLANDPSVAYINVRQVASQNTYFMTVDGYMGSYQTGDAPRNSDVANGLAAAINGQGGFVAFRVSNTNVIRVQRTNGQPISLVTASDTYNNGGLQVVSNGVEKFSDLPAGLDSGYVVSVLGTEGSKSRYYVRWNGKAWEECAKPGSAYRLDPTTMPHRLRPNTDGTWTFERITDWADRLTGDDKTAPLPTFVDDPIKAVFFHRNRLGFLSADAVTLSRAGDYFNFFPASAQQVLDSDPIDLSAGSESVTNLTWALGFNQTLLLWSNTDKQFVLTAGDILSPKTARVLPTTAFAFKPTVRPASMGNKALFAAPFGDYTQVNLYRVSDDRLTNTADDLTEDCPQYLPSGVTHMEVSNTVRALVASSHAWTNELYVWKWEQDDQQKLTQRAWQRFTLDRAEPVRVLGTHWVDRTLYLLICTRAVTESAHHFTIEKLEFGKPKDDFGANVPLLLDRAVKMQPTNVSAAGTTFDLPYPVSGPLTVLKLRAGGLEPEVVTPSGVAVLAPTVTRVTLAGAQPGDYVLGQAFNFTYTFTEPFMQDRDSVPFMASYLKHVRTIIRYEMTGYFKAEVVIPLRATYVYPFSGRIAGQPNQAASMVALSSGDFAIPVQAKASGVLVSLKSDSYLPCRFPYGEWVGDVTMKASR